MKITINKKLYKSIGVVSWGWFCRGSISSPAISAPMEDWEDFLITLEMVSHYPIFMDVSYLREVQRKTTIAAGKWVSISEWLKIEEEGDNENNN